MKPRDEDQVSDQWQLFTNRRGLLLSSFPHEQTSTSPPSWLGFAAHQMEGGFGAHDEG
jgi:hypothetical protein